MLTPGQKNIILFKKYINKFSKNKRKLNGNPHASRIRITLGIWNLFYSKCELPWKDLTMDLMSQTKTMIHTYIMKTWCNKVCFHIFRLFSKVFISWFLKSIISQIFVFSQKIITFSNDQPKLVPNQSHYALCIWDDIRPTSRTFTEGLTYVISGQFLDR